MTDVTEGIRDYLASGGLFNPELMDHQRVRDLVIECRAEIERLRMELAKVGNSSYNPALVPRERDAEIERLRDERDRLAGSLAVCGVIAHEGDGACLPEYETNSVIAVKAMRAEIKRLRAEVEPLRIALGLLTTIKPTMEIDVTDPVGMAQQIAAHVADEIKRLRGLLREGLSEHVRLHVHPHFPAWEKRAREALGE